jgi:hypothetical protein
VGGIEIAAATSIGPAASHADVPLIRWAWAYGFVFDACANGQQLKRLTVIGE